MCKTVGRCHEPLVLLVDYVCAARSSKINYFGELAGVCKLFRLKLPDRNFDFIKLDLLDAVPGFNKPEVNLLFENSNSYLNYFKTILCSITDNFSPFIELV